MKKTIILILVLINYGLSFGKVLSTFEEISKPNQIAVSKEFIYISEKYSIYIYSKRDFSFIKKIGQKGEGPGEFLSISSFYLRDKNIIVNSSGKISYIKENGDFLYEKKFGENIIGQRVELIPIRESFIGNGTKIVGKTLFTTINIYNSDFKKIKELNRVKISDNKNIYLLPKSAQYETYKNKIYLISKNGFGIDVYNVDGKKMQTFGVPKYRPKILNDKEIRKRMEEKNKIRYSMIKDRISFPKYYPEILKFFISNDFIYIATWKWENKKVEFYVFSLKGELKIHKFIPLYFNDGIFPYPYPLTIYKNKIFQLFENEDEENWNLIVNRI